MRITVRPLGTSLPLGFIAFGVGTTLLSAVQNGWVPVVQSKQTAIVFLAFVAPLELIASLFAFPGRDATAAAALGIFGALWLALGWNLLVAVPGSTSVALGVFLLTVSGFILLLAAVSVADKPILTILLSLAVLRFALSGAYEATRSKSVELAAGWSGLPLALAALYGALALVLEDTRRQTVLPLLRRGPSRRALQSGLPEQFRGIEHEAGVRKQL